MMKDLMDEDFDDLCKSGVNENKTENPVSEPVLHFLGRAFTMSELAHIASFATDLKQKAVSIAGEDYLPNGTVYMVKVFGKDVQVSFAGIAKK
jgi:hypothetical protein